MDSAYHSLQENGIDYSKYWNKTLKGIAVGGFFVVQCVWF